jgi:polar amino acid transport system substrate-binding protein
MRTAMRAAWILVTVAIVAAGCSSPDGGATVESSAMTPLSASARAELAPNGRLRAALNYGNVLLVTTRGADPTGVAPDLARELARRAGAVVEFVGYENAGLAADAAEAGAWDVAFIGAEPARAAAITFTPAYVEIEATYLVPPGSSLTAVDDVDRNGIRIASAARAAYTLYLQRTLRHATLVEAEGAAGAFDRFVSERLDALAGLAPRLIDEAAKLPGSRILAGRFTAVQQAMGVPNERAAAAAYLSAFGEEIKASGLLASLIARHDVRGLSIAARSGPR